jgi:hypothetical protein
MTMDALKKIEGEVQRDVDRAQEAYGVPKEKRVTVPVGTVTFLVDGIKANFDALDFLAKM